MNKDDSAFAFYYPNDTVDGSPHFGMTKREYIATTVLAGMTAGLYGHAVDKETFDRLTPEYLAKIAVLQTDALIKELSK